MTFFRMLNSGNIRKFILLLTDLQAVKAMLSWPEFSMTAYGMVSDLFKQGIRPRTIIDVGANVGQFAVAALNIFKGVSVHAFEPIEGCVEKLRANTSRYSDVHIHAVALSSKCGKATFYLNSYNLASSMLKISARHQSEFSHTTEKETVNIEVSTLDHFFSNAVLRSPVLLKIDVQGAEKLVIEGGRETLKNVDYVLLEASFTPMYVGEPLFLEMIQVMNMLNFNFLRPIGFLKSPIGSEILQTDALFKRDASRV